MEGPFARKNEAAITTIALAGMIFFTNGLFVGWDAFLSRNLKPADFRRQ
jgi:hypothetical protein